MPKTNCPSRALVGLAGLFSWGLCLTQTAWGQADRDFLLRTSPGLTYQPPQARNYNLKWGNLQGRISGSLQTEYNDNINLSDNHAKSDFIFFPNVGLGFLLPLSDRNQLQLDVGVGYRVYVDHSELNDFHIVPDSRFNYQLRAGKIQITIRDKAETQYDPLTRAGVSGSNRDLLNFRRVVNDAGILAELQANSDWVVFGSYDYIIDRSISGEFEDLDRDDHNFSLGTLYKLDSRWTVGFTGAVTLSDYLERVQNNGVSYTIGPTVTFKPTQFITLDAAVGYTSSDYDQSGTILDRDDFSGVTFAASARHTINSRMSHSLRAIKALTPGYGSNFTDLFSLQYGVIGKLAAGVNANATLVYEHLDESGATGEKGDRYLCYLGTGFQVAQRWNLGVAYSFAWKNSNIVDRDYTQNRVMIDVTHDF